MNPPVPARAPGRLILVPTPLDHGCQSRVPLAAVLPRATIEMAARLDHWICENAKSARAFLKRVGAETPLAQPMQQITIRELEHSTHKKGDHATVLSREYACELLAAALAGDDVGLLSEAGMPALADPGSSVVRAAHDLEIGVVPLVGPVSIALALAASGLNGQDFAFAGYLPRAGAALAARVRALESHALQTAQTQIFIETPYRNAALLQALLAVLRPETRLCLALGLTLPEQHIWCARTDAWRQRATPGHIDLPAVFAIGR